MKLKEVAQIKFCLASTTPRDENEERMVLTPACLTRKELLNLEDRNELLYEEAKYKIDDDTLLEEGTIIIKRVCPLGATYIEKTNNGWETYSCANSIIIKTIDLDAKYLACVLNDVVPKIIDSMKGTRLPALGRKIVDDIDIPDLPIEKQKLLGQLWYDGIKLKELNLRLAHMQDMLNKQTILKYIKEN